MNRSTRAFIRFRKNPSSVRYAAAAITATIVVLVLLGAVLMRVFASEQYSFGDAVWFSLQTVTTVGYGDNTPDSSIGRVMASVVMLVSIGLVTVITAVITSLFIRAVSQEQDRADQQATTESLARVEAQLEAAINRLERIEQRGADPGQAAPVDTVT